MLPSSKGFFKKTKRGGIVNVVREHYVRDDIYCGSKLCTVCPTPANPQTCLTADPPVLDSFGPHYAVPDTNIFLNHMDLIEHAAISNMIVTQTVLDEVRHRSLPIYNRLRALIANPERHFYVFSNEHHPDTLVKQLPGESPNDKNDRAIRVVALWFRKHLAGANVHVIMLSDDAGNRAFAEKEGLPAVTVGRYAKLFSSAPDLVDMVGAAGSLDGFAQDGTANITYDEYLSPSNVSTAVASGKLLQGTLQISGYNVFEGHIMASLPNASENRVYIHGRNNLNRAIQGDVVAVQLLPKEQWIGAGDQAIVESDDDEEVGGPSNNAADKDSPDPNTSTANKDDAVTLLPTGKVVAVIKRNWRPLCGTIEKPKASASSGAQNVYFFPMDRRIPKVRIRTRQADQLIGQRIIVNIDSWERTSRYPNGHFVKLLGPSLDKETETEVILLEHGVPYEPFSQAVLNDLPPEGENWICLPEELARRRDLRHLPVCSIDPPGCTDIDDALHVRTLANGNLEVGVHIADVTHFVRPRTAMDAEAEKRGTTVYLVDKRIDMLPGLLGTNLCSLRSNVDRLAFSCLWEMTADADIVKVEYTKSIIHSKASFTYEEAQLRIDDERMQDELTNGVRTLNMLAKKLRQRRLDAGALTLASPEVRFRLEGDAQDPVDVELKALKETNALVEEFMLLANVSVAEKVFSTFPNTAMLRCHPTPPPENFAQLNQALERFGVSLNVTSSKTLSDSLDQAISPTDAYFNQLVRILTTRCMMQAQYFCSGMLPREQFRHYGLAMPIYTHFTSPIRRYADVIVHRLLAASIAHDSFAYGEELTNKDVLNRVAENLNYRHRMAQQASRSSVELFTHVYFKGKILIEPAYVTRVLRNGISALIPKYGIEANIVLDKDVWKFNAEKNCIASSYAELTMFDPVTVRIEVVELERGSGSQKVVMTLIQPAAPTSDEMDVDGRVGSKVSLGTAVPFGSQASSDKAREEQPSLKRTSSSPPQSSSSSQVKRKRKS